MVKVYIIGTGVDGDRTLTREAAEIIERADVLIGASRMLEPFRKLGKNVYEEYRSDEIRRYLAANSFSTAAVLMSGDCGFFSGAKKLSEQLEGADVEIVCGVSSAVYFFSKLKKDWSDCKFISLHGKNANIVRNVCSHRNTFFLLGGDVSAADVCRLLSKYNMGYVSVYIGSRLGYSDERILIGTAQEFGNINTSDLSVMLVENSQYEQYLQCGICDEEFIRGKVPMTKSVVRTAAVSALNIGINDVCWDIGSGTGSVAVEMALRCIDGTVYAVEKNSDGIGLIAENRHKFGCDNIEIIAADAADAVDDLPVPDCVFVGGSGGQLKHIISTAFEKNSDIRLVITAVTLETMNESIAIFNELRIEAEITQIAVTKVEKVGNYSMLKAENPVFIIKRKMK